MTPEQLKNSILQLAIQGKLTEEFRAQSVERRELKAENGKLKDDPRLSVLNSQLNHNRHCEATIDTSLRGVKNAVAIQKISPLLKGNGCGSNQGDFKENNEEISMSKNPPVCQRQTSLQWQSHPVATCTPPSLAAAFTKEGKLETAEELYKQIQAEKAELIKQGKIKKDKNESTTFKRGNSYFEKIGNTEKCIDDELPFDIPDSWRWVRLGNICSKIGSGSTPTGGKNVYVEKGIKFIRSQNVYNDGLRLKDIVYINDEINNKMLGSNVFAKDILLNITGGSIGRTALVPDDFDIANINQHILIIRLIELAQRYWIHTVLTSPYIQQFIMAVQVGVSREGLSAEKTKRFLIPLPSLSEQHAIVAKIEELLPLVEKYGKAYNKLEVLNKNFPAEIKKSILQYAIQGKLTEEFRAQSVERRELKAENGKLKDDSQLSVLNSQLNHNRHCEATIDTSLRGVKNAVAIQYKLPLLRGDVEQSETERFLNNNEEISMSKNPPVCQRQTSLQWQSHPVATCTPPSLAAAFTKEGKLETAEELLAKIQAEKAELIKQGKIKKDKNESTIFKRGNSYFEKIGDTEKCIDDELPFDIPDSWQWARLGVISTYGYSKQKQNALNADKNTWCLELEDIEKGGKLLEKKKIADKKAIGDKTIFYKGDILYSKLRPYLLKILVADEDGICTPEIVPFKVFGNINHSYIVNYLKSPFVDALVNSQTYGMKMPRAGSETLLNLLVPLPSLFEQHAIVAKIEELFALVDNLPK